MSHIRSRVAAWQKMRADDNMFKVKVESNQEYGDLSFVSDSNEARFPRVNGRSCPLWRDCQNHFFIGIKVMTNLINDAMAASPVYRYATKPVQYGFQTWFKYTVFTEKANFYPEIKQNGDTEEKVPI